MAANSTNNVNQASPTVVIPVATANLLPAGAKLSLSFVKSPITYITTTSPQIVSQVVTINCKLNKTSANVVFPNGPALIINLPWAYVPFTVSNGLYNTSCTVYKYVNSTFVVEPLCTIDGVNSNAQKAVLNCKNFGNFALACKGAKVSTAAYVKNNTNSTNSSLNSNKSGASYVTISLVLISILSLIII